MHDIVLLNIQIYTYINILIESVCKGVYDLKYHVEVLKI